MNTVNNVSRSRVDSYRKITKLAIGATDAAMTFAGVATPAFAGAETGALRQNEQLNPGQRLITPNGIALAMQGDGNLVEYAPGNRPVWASNTNRPGSVLRMQNDGNLVIIAPGNIPVWNTRTNGNPGADLELQNDGNAVVYASGHITKWANGVQVTSPSGQSTQTLAQQIVANPRIDKSGRLVLSDLQAAASGKPASAGTPLSTTLLRMIATLGQNHTFKISALESGGTGHVSDSLHFAGRAVDISRLDGQDVTGRNAPSHVIKDVFLGFMPAGSGFGQVQCAGTSFSLAPGISQFQDSCNHLHTQLARNTP